MSGQPEEAVESLKLSGCRRSRGGRNCQAAVVEAVKSLKLVSPKKLQEEEENRMVCRWKAS